MQNTSEIWEKFNGRLYQFILSRIKDPDTARDILQDVFIKVHLKLGSLKNEEKLTSWIYQITRNSLLDFFKKKKHQTSGDLEKIIREEPEEEPGPELVHCLMPFIDQLEPKYKEAIMETGLGTLSQKEFAEKKGISYSGAKSRVQRAREQLHGLFTSCCKVHADAYGNIIDHNCKNNCGCD